MSDYVIDLTSALIAGALNDEKSILSLRAGVAAVKVATRSVQYGSADVTGPRISL